MKKILLLMLVVFASLCNNVYAQFNVDENLLLYLNFDDAVLSTNDQAIAATNVTAVAGPGKFGKAAIFDGTTYVAMTPIPAYDPHTKAIAYSFWMKTGVTTGEDIFVYNLMTDPTGTDNMGRVAMSLRFDNKLGADIGWVGGNLEGDPGVDNTPGLLSDNNWHHVVAAFNVLGTNIKLYIDNVQVDDITTSGFGEIVPGEDFDFTNFLLFLGMGASDYPGFELGWAPTFTGSLDEFRMFQTADQLTPADIDVLYNYKPQQATSQFDVDENLLLYLNFDDAALTTNEQEVAATAATAVSGNGKFGKAAIFDGTTYVAMTPIPAYDPHTKAIAYSFWMKTGVTTGEDIFVYNLMTDPTGTDNMGRVAMSLRFDDKLGVDIGWRGGSLEGDPGVDNTPGLLSDNNWHHVVAAFNVLGTNIKLYIDNVLVDDISTGGMGEIVPGEDFDFTNFLLFLGMGAADYPGFELGWAPTFTGALDEFRMFQTADQLTPADVADLYNYVPVTSAVKAVESNSQLVKVYPNPATNFIIIQSAGYNISVDIMNSNGQKVLSVRNNKQIDVSSLSKGMYFVKVTDGSVTSTQKILVN